MWFDEKLNVSREDHTLKINNKNKNNDDDNDKVKYSSHLRLVGPLKSVGN